MLTLSERPLNDAERENLTRRMAAARAESGKALIKSDGGRGDRLRCSRPLYAAGVGCAGVRHHRIPAVTTGATCNVVKRRTRTVHSMRIAIVRLAAVCALLALISAPAAEQNPNRRVAFTIDDLPTVSVLGDDLARARRTTDGLLAALRRQKIPAIGFVNESKLGPAVKPHSDRVALLQQWIDTGLELGNHTFSHVDLHRVTPETFEAEIAKGEIVTRRLLESTGRQLTFFRHPFLHTGTSPETRKHVRAFLDAHRYVVAPVTIDNYDYIFAAAYDRTVARGDAANTRRIEDAYMDYMLSVVAFYEEQSRLIVGREIAQTLLLHAHALNAATLDRLADALRTRGYRFITLREALEDPAYSLRDEYYGPAGITWLHRWALTEGKRGIFAGEPVVPEWIEKAAQGR
jgi:peptidoglycan/xylan/chitin deacetylase (PgdA/CDA1 family)